MTINVGTIWGIYLVAVVVSFIILIFFLNVGYAFLFATLLGAIAAFIAAAWLDPNALTSNEKTWLGVLFIVAFLLPIFVLLCVAWAGSNNTPCCDKIKDPCDKCKPKKPACEVPKPVCAKPKCPCEKDPCTCKVAPVTEPVHTKQTIQCDPNTGQCHVTKKKIYQGNDITTVVYSPWNIAK